MGAPYKRLGRKVKYDFRGAILNGLLDDIHIPDVSTIIALHEVFEVGEIVMVFMRFRIQGKPMHLSTKRG